MKITYVIMAKKKKKEVQPIPSNKADLLIQISNEYTSAKNHLTDKKDVWEKRLKLYNNQKRDVEKIGDPLLFGVMQTVLASLYDDKLMVTFEGREIGDDPNAEVITSVAEYDYDNMRKSELDYDWDWNTLFFGRALCAVMDWDEKQSIPIPELFDPMVTVRDSYCTSINGGYSGKGAARFFGRPIYATEHELKSGNYIKKEVDNMLASATDTELRQSTEARNESAGTNTVLPGDKDIGDNKLYELLQWFTHYKGKKVMVVTDASHSYIVKLFDVNDDKWPISERVLFPTPNDYDGVTVPDLCEDKQRHRAIVLNNAVESIENNQKPTYFFNQRKVTAPQYLNYNLGNKFIPVDGSPGDVVKQMDRQVVKQEAIWILDQLSNNADKALATPAIRQGGLSQEKRQATELNLVNQGVDARFSLSAKVFGWSEKEFWRLWFKLYKDNYKDSTKGKIIKVVGELGSKDLHLKKSNLKTNRDLNIKVESKIVSEGKKMDELKKVGNFKMLTSQDSTVNQKYVNRKLAKLSGFSDAEMVLLYPPSPDEIIAKEENVLLSQNKPVNIAMEENHIEHIFVNNQAKDSNAKSAHILAHKAALKAIKKNPKLAPQETAEAIATTRSKSEDKGSLPKVNYDSNLI